MGTDPNAAGTIAAIEASPEVKRWLESARKHAKTGAGANLSLRMLADLVPAVEPFWHLEAPAPQGSAP
jgi:hypothetical protein